MSTRPPAAPAWVPPSTSTSSTTPAGAGAHTVRAVTSPVNTASIAFHRALGFAVSPVEPDYDGPGHDRVCFTRTVAER